MATVAIDIRVIGRKRTGDETVFLELCKKLIRHHTEHQYYLLTDKTTEELVGVQEKLGIQTCPAHVKIFNFGPQNKFWWNLCTLPHFLRKQKEIDVFHTQYILPFFLPKHLPVIAHIHDVSFARLPRLISFKDRLFLRLLIPRTMRRATLVVPSIFTKQEIQDIYKVPEQRIVVITNAVPERFSSVLGEASSENQKQVVKKYNLPKNYWLYVGTLQPRKNIPYLLQILCEVKKRLPLVTLVLAGDREGHHFDQGIDQSIKDLQLEGAVVFPGYIADEDLPKVYQGAELFVFPSVYEGFGIPLLEALAVGTRVAASLIPPHQEVAGGNAVYFPLDNLASAAEILYNLSVKTQNDQEPLNAYTKPNIYFFWEKSATALAQLYQRLSGG